MVRVSVILLLLFSPNSLLSEVPDLTKLPLELRSYSDWQAFPNIKVHPPSLGQCWIPPKHADYMANQEVEKGPHKDKLLSVFANRTGAQVIQQFRVKHFSPGSIIVKEKKTTATASPHAVGAMVKHEAGFDTSVGDWEFMYLSEENEFTRGNKEAANCVSFHQRASKTDFVFGNYGQRPAE